MLTLVTASSLYAGGEGSGPKAPCPQCGPHGGHQAEPWKSTEKDLVKVSPPKRFPKGAYKGEVDLADGFVMNVYLVQGRGYVGEPRPGGHGEVIRMLPGSFHPKDFEKLGEHNLGYATLTKWRFRQPK